MITTGSVEEATFWGVDAIVLRWGDLSATFLPTVGMTGVSLQCRGAEYLATPGDLAALHAGGTLGIPLLAPWANRLAQWRYHAAGVDVDLDGLPLGVDDNGLPMHGLLIGQPGWRIRSQSFRGGSACLDASIDVEGPAFPFPHRIELAIALHEGGLTIDTTVVPTGARPVPIAFGWHPYLRLPDVDRSQWRLQTPAYTHLALDDRGIPTGASTAKPQQDEPIGERTFDDLYRLGHVHSLAIVADNGASATMRCEYGYPYAQLWVPPGRSFVALEPMTSPTNSLVDGTADIVEPGAEHRCRFGLAVTAGAS